MPEIRTNLYEGLFLLSQQAVASDFAGSLDHVRQILLKAKAEIVAIRKWDERKLAYEVKGQKRGTFVIAHFNAQSDKLTMIDRDCNLSEVVLRAMHTACVRSLLAPCLLLILCPLLAFPAAAQDTDIVLALADSYISLERDEEAVPTPVELAAPVGDDGVAEER